MSLTAALCCFILSNMAKDKFSEWGWFLTPIVWLALELLFELRK